MHGRSVELSDQLSIETPELVNIDLPLAGVGSRCLALLIDYLIQGTALTIGILFLAFLSTLWRGSAQPAHPSHGYQLGQKLGLAIVIAMPFLLHWGYFTLFEAFWNGQTPVKRMTRLRVIQQSGRALGLFESMGRNLIRFVDMLPGFYVVGVVCVLVSRRQQRLGDMTAGTLVVHTNPVVTPMSLAGNRIFTPVATDHPAEHQPVRTMSVVGLDAVGRLHREDLQVIENFLDRRLDLPLDVRAKLAEKLSVTMAAKMQMEKPAVSDETFLESLVIALRHGAIN
jgi:uncharacterized RDD family membrane protein YckC